MIAKICLSSFLFNEPWSFCELSRCFFPKKARSLIKVRGGRNEEVRNMLTFQRNVIVKGGGHLAETALKGGFIVLVIAPPFYLKLTLCKDKNTFKNVFDSCNIAGNSKQEGIKDKISQSFLQQ